MKPGSKRGVADTSGCQHMSDFLNKRLHHINFEKIRHSFQRIKTDCVLSRIRLMCLFLATFFDADTSVPATDWKLNLNAHKR